MKYENGRAFAMSARTITSALRGKWHKGGYGLAFCPAHPNTRTPALRLRDGRDGRLLAVCGAGCDFRDVAAALRARGLAGDAGRVERDPVADARREREEREAAERRKRQALRLLAKCEPIDGTLAERYLRARAIRGRLPAALRFAPSAWHPSARELPAMVAVVEREGEAGPVAAHRTYLAEPGRKADVDPPRAMLGACAGAAVRLGHGAGPLIVAEGIETALSLADGLTDLAPSVWAALSASGVAGLRLPARPGELIVAPDGDPAGERAATALATRAAAAGWRVRVLPPPGPGLDWNDQAKREAAQ